MLALSVAAIAGAAAIYWGVRGLRHDDAFILYQYARNVASGVGFVFNPGERVLGVTSPLLTLVLAAIYAVFGDVLPQASVALSAVGIAVQAVLLQRLLREALPVTSWALFGFTLLGLHGSYAFAALETNVYAALALATLWASERGRPLVCGMGLGLAFLCRYDAALLVPVLALRPRPDRARFLARAFGTAALVAFPWMLFSVTYFGAWAPRTLAAKRGMLAFPEYLGGALTRILGAPWEALGGTPGFASRAAVAALSLLGVVAVLRHLPELRGLVALCVLQLVAYAAIGPNLEFHWHTYLPQLGTAVLLVVGVGWALEGRIGRRHLSPAASRAALVVLSLVAAACLGRHALEFSRTLPDQYWHGRRHARYEAVSAWVTAHARPGQSLMASEIGTLGYLTRCRMLDPYGLINPTNDLPRTHRFESYVELVQAHRPDLILADDEGVGRALEATLGYRVVHVFPWKHPWSTLLVRDPSVLVDPARSM